MDLSGETGDLCSCWMGAHSDDSKQLTQGAAMRETVVEQLVLMRDFSNKRFGAQ